MSPWTKKGIGARVQQLSRNKIMNKIGGQIHKVKYTEDKFKNNQHYMEID